MPGMQTVKALVEKTQDSLCRKKHSRHRCYDRPGYAERSSAECARIGDQRYSVYSVLTKLEGGEL